MKINYKRGSATPKGKINTIRLITKEHNIYKPEDYDIFGRFIGAGSKIEKEKLRQTIENKEN